MRGVFLLGVEDAIQAITQEQSLPSIFPTHRAYARGTRNAAFFGLTLIRFPGAGSTKVLLAQTTQIPCRCVEKSANGNHTATKVGSGALSAIE